MKDPQQIKSYNRSDPVPDDWGNEKLQPKYEYKDQYEVVGIILTFLSWSFKTRLRAFAFNMFVWSGIVLAVLWAWGKI